MEHSFNVQFAQKYGIEEAIIVHNFYFWLRKNVANEKHLYNGRHWTYNSNNAFAALFPYINKTKIFRVLKHLEECGVILKGNFNTNVWDKTLWYSFSDHGLDELCASGYDVADFVKMNHRDNQSETTIPYSKHTDIITDSKKEDNKLSYKKEELTWRDDFNLFLDEVNRAMDTLMVDKAFRDKQERYYPHLDYELSLHKMVEDYWGTEEAWKKRKRQKKNQEGIDMVATLKKGFSQSFNRVYKQTNRAVRQQADLFSGYSPNKVSERAKDYLRTLKVGIAFEKDGVTYLKDDTFIQDGKRYYRNKFGLLVEVPVGLVARPNEKWEYSKKTMVWVQDEQTITVDDYMF